MYGLSWKEIRVDVWGFWVVEGVVGLSWDDVGEDWLCDCWVAIFDRFLNYYFSEKVYVYYNILPKKWLEKLLLGQMWWLLSLCICILSKWGMIKMLWKLQTKKKYQFYWKLFVSFRQVVWIVPVDIIKGFGKLEK